MLLSCFYFEFLYYDHALEFYCLQQTVQTLCFPLLKLICSLVVGVFVTVLTQNYKMLPLFNLFNS